VTDCSCGAGRAYSSVEQRLCHQAALLFDVARRQLSNRGPRVPVGLDGFRREPPRLGGRDRTISVMFHAPIILWLTAAHNPPIDPTVFSEMNTG
jgi:hypothetical protein